MIQAQTIQNRCLALLDAEGSDRYLFDPDFKPAINIVQDWVVSLFNKAFAENKISPESLRDLTRTDVFKASSASRVQLRTDDSIKFWSILAVLVDLTYVQEAAALAANPVSGIADSYQSVWLSDNSTYKVTYLTHQYEADRATAEEYAQKEINPFASGSSLISNTDLKKYAYTDPGMFPGGGYSLVGSYSTAEIEISPSIANQVVAIRFIKIPDEITLVTDYIEFPDSLTDLFVEKVLQFISQKQNEVPLFQTSDAEVNKLIDQMQ